MKLKKHGCSKVEICHLVGLSQTMHKEIKEICEIKYNTHSGSIKDKNGDLIMDKQDVLQRWSEYIEELYKDKRGDKPKIIKNLEGLPILKDEARKALKKMKQG